MDPNKNSKAKTTKTSKHRALKLIASPVVGFISLFYLTGLLERLDYGYIDFLFNTRLTFWGVNEIDPGIVLAALDEKSIAEIGSVPWPRSVYGQLFDKLKKHKTEVVAVDVLFTEPDRRHPEDDQALVDATRRWKKGIIHSFFETVQPDKSGMTTIQQIMPFDGLRRTPARVAFVDDTKLEGSQIISSKDRDGFMRRTFLAKQTAGGDYALSLGAEVFAALKGLTAQQFMGNYPAEINVNFPGVHKNKTTEGKIIVTEPYPAISITDIIHDRLEPAARQQLRGAIVFVGSIATGYYDHFPTPYVPMAPGVGIHIYALNNLLKNNYLKITPSTVTLFLIVAVGLLVAVFLEQYSARTNVIILGPLLLGMFGLSVYLFVYHNIVFPVLIPAVTGLLTMAGVTLYRVAVEEKEKRWIKSTFSQYLSPKVVSLLVENPDALSLGGQKRDITVLFLDIQGFTTISEKMPPDELTKLLNKYLTLFTDVILKYDGVVDKFIGDAVMAFWNAPFEQPKHQLSACLAALEIHEKVKEMGAQEPMPIKVRVGIHGGPMIVGNMGSQARFNYTVVGDNVNLASRLEGANKFFKTALLISEDIYRAVEGEIAARELGPVRVVGKENPIGVYELIGRGNGAFGLIDPALDAWRQAMAKLKEGDLKTGRKLFEEYLQAHRDDPTALYYLKLIESKKIDSLVINLAEK